MSVWNKYLLIPRFSAFRQLSTKCETDNHPLCGWATKVIPQMAFSSGEGGPLAVDEENPL